jgi:hypothetical protein
VDIEGFRQPFIAIQPYPDLSNSALLYLLAIVLRSFSGAGWRSSVRSWRMLARFLCVMFGYELPIVFVDFSRHSFLPIVAALRLWLFHASK